MIAAMTPPTSDTPWYVDAFRADYLDVYSHRDEAAAAREAKAALSLLRFDPTRGRLLDLAAGAGRHSLAFRALRCEVVSLDLSADLMTRARAAGLRCARADMRALPLRDWSFAAVAMLFSSFGYFHDDADHERTLGEVARVLEPGGAALLDLMDRETVRSRLVPQDVDVLDGMTLEIERRMTPDLRRVEKSIRMIRDGSHERGWTESVRLFTGAELDAMATRVGLDVEATVGDYDGRPHVSGQTRRLVVLRKPRR